MKQQPGPRSARHQRKRLWGMATDPGVTYCPDGPSANTQGKHSVFTSDLNGMQFPLRSRLVLVKQTLAISVLEAVRIQFPTRLIML